eukprot:9008626-Pyramimonas_sp.AAC.1
MINVFKKFAEVAPELEDLEKFLKANRDGSVQKTTADHLVTILGQYRSCSKAQMLKHMQSISETLRKHAQTIPDNLVDFKP